ncbi:HCP-like protein [Rhizoctonia solani]|uniref:HCP-like protein n=1 Tax=Rhizoctonia solani TaxID=456999 RepID=A0A8H7M7E8_9AGAM|nr:HCP-like protein [Rhizoctonia solani]
MVNTPPPPAYEHEEYNHIVDYYDHTRDEDGPSASASSSAPVPSSNAAPPTQAPTLREGTMNGQAPRQTSLHEGDMLPAPGRPFMQLANRSTPSFSPHPRDPGFEHPPLPNNRHFPPPSSYDPNDLAFNSMHINDPIQRAGTSMSYRAGDPRADPIPDPAPPCPIACPRPEAPLPTHLPTTTPIPIPSGVALHPWPSRPPRPPRLWRHHASLWPLPEASSSPGSYNRMPPPPPQDDGMYAAASFAGLDLPPGSAPPSLFIPPNPGAPYYPPPGPGGPGPSDGGGYLSPSQSSIMRGSSAASIRTDDTGDDFQMRSSLQRTGTTLSVAPTTKKIKAIDANQLPYTKEFVDQYRASMKEDPDPESHFKYAKYLIEAAKRIGEDAQDQRAVRKYRDTLIGESLKVIRKLATTGDTFPDAQFFLANCYGTGMLGLQVDHEKAYHLYMQAAKQNHAAACYRVAVCNEIGAGTRKDPKHAFAFYKKAASLGDTAAMYKLGMIYLQGQLGQQKSPRDGVPWLRRAAEQADVENPHALHELGLLHEQPGSQVVVHDEAYAKDLFTRAAQLGFVRSQFKLGAAYEYGQLTCPVDPKRSIAWYTKAAQKGDAEAELALSGWYLTGSEGVLKQSDSEAYLWARRAANKGLSKAEYAVGYYAEVGIGLKVDVEFAKRWYMRAAAQGNKRAMARLTDLKRAGNRRVAPGARPTRAQANNEDCVIA